MMRTVGVGMVRLKRNQVRMRKHTSDECRREHHVQSMVQSRLYGYIIRQGTRKITIPPDEFPHGHTGADPAHCRDFRPNQNTPDRCIRDNALAPHVYDPVQLMSTRHHSVCVKPSYETCRAFSPPFVEVQTHGPLTTQRLSPLNH